MNEKSSIARLGEVADLIMESRLSALRQAAAARQGSLDRLEHLAKPMPAADLPPASAQAAAVLYQRWVDLCRVEVNLTLARQTATWLQAQEEARQAFGKAQALAAIIARGRRR